MNLKQYVTEVIPDKCGVNRAYSKLAWMGFEEEQINPDLFPAGAFKTARDRAKLALPFKPRNVKEYEKCLDVIEYVILRHRHDKHGEDNQARMDELMRKRVYDADEKKIMFSDIWNG